MSDWIPEEDWVTIVKNAPIVSVDLVIECPDGIVLGERSNEPAKGKWFVPGGRVQKSETLDDAVERVATTELGADVEIRDELGAFEHFYETSEVGCSKQYVAHGYYVWTAQTSFATDDQHRAFRTFEEVPSDLHQYVEDYLDAAAVTE